MSDTPIDWRAMPAGDDLDRFIAERLGWYIEKQSNEDYPGVGTEFEWYLVKPNELARFVCDYEEGRETLDQAWANALERFDGHSDIPHFSRDTDAALAVLPCTPDSAVMLYKNYGWNGSWQVHISFFYGRKSFMASAETLALAACRVWLDWKTQDVSD